MSPLPADRKREFLGQGVSVAAVPHGTGARTVSRSEDKDAPHIRKCTADVMLHVRANIMRHAKGERDIPPTWATCDFPDEPLVRGRLCMSR
jgi:hypothetical protein